MTVNLVQHGGDHYKAAFEHWDLVSDLGLNYYQACASKYITRHRKKNGREDILKAKHFVEKHIELIKTNRLAPPIRQPGSLQTGRYSLVTEFFSANGVTLGSYESIALLNIMMPMGLPDLENALPPLDALLEEYDAADPSPAYVNQDR